MAAIVRDGEIRSGDPGLDGTRITVLVVERRVIDASEDSSAVAAEYDLDDTEVTYLVGPPPTRSASTPSASPNRARTN